MRTAINDVPVIRHNSEESVGAKRKADVDRDAIAEMLEEFGKAVASGDFAGVSYYYAYPLLMISDGGARSFKKPAEVEAMFAEGREWHEISKEMAEARPNLQTFEHLSEQTAAVTVGWVGYDGSGRENYNEKWYYVIQNIDGEPRIRISMTCTK